MSDEATRDGQRFINDWLGAIEGVDRAKGDLNRCEVAVINARNALAKWMLPEDAKVGEKIALWHGDSLIQVEVRESDAVVSVRKRGRKLHYQRGA